MHAQMRMGCSKLNYHLYRNLHVIPSKACSCGCYSETTSHYFFACSKYVDFRQSLFDSVNSIIPANVTLNLNLLLYGNNALTYEQNIKIFEAVQNYMQSTNRFQ